MKEARNNMLPIEMEAELSKDWGVIVRHYQHFLPNAETLCKAATRFPVSRRLSFRSALSGLTWNIVIAAYDKGCRNTSYGFYTPYTNEHGKKGCYSISTEECERITPHFLHRLQSRYMKPNGLTVGNLDELMEFYYREIQPETTLIFQHKYMMLRHGIGIVDVAGNGVITYITFVTYEMIRDYQSVYKKLADRMLQLYAENNEEWDNDKFVQIIAKEGLMPEDDELREIRKAPKRELKRKEQPRTRWQARNEEIRKKREEEIAAEFLPGTGYGRPSTQQFLSPAEMEEALRKWRGKP